jgi:hypothetical protein
VQEKTDRYPTIKTVKSTAQERRQEAMLLSIDTSDTVHTNINALRLF